MVQAFHDNNGHLSLSNLSTIVNSSQPYLHDYVTSLELAGISAAVAAAIGLVGDGRPRAARRAGFCVS